MARMYSRKKGKSGSKKPMEMSSPWVKYTKNELEEIITKLAGKGMQSAQIGLVLRDQYGVPSTHLAIKKSIKQVLLEKKLYAELPEDMYSLIKKAVNLHVHMDKNKKDYTSKRGLEITESKIRKIAKYYKKEKVIDKDWAYNLEKAKLLVK